MKKIIIEDYSQVYHTYYKKDIDFLDDRNLIGKTGVLTNKVNNNRDKFREIKLDDGSTISSLWVKFKKI